MTEQQVIHIKKIAKNWWQFTHCPTAEFVIGVKDKDLIVLALQMHCSAHVLLEHEALFFAPLKVLLLRAWSQLCQGRAAAILLDPLHLVRLPVPSLARPAASMLCISNWIHWRRSTQANPLRLGSTMLSYPNTFSSWSPILVHEKRYLHLYHRLNI